MPTPTPHSQPDEGKEREFRQLVAAVRTGDRAAMNSFIAPWREYLLLIANEDMQSRLQGKLGASDLVQQTMAAACERMDQFRGTSPAELKAWLRRILHNCMHDEERRFLVGRGRAVGRERPLGDAASQAAALRDPHITPQSDAVLQEEAEILERAMAQLPDHYRHVVRARNWEEKSFVEIGQELNMSPEAARKIWFRGIVKLEAALKPLLEPIDPGESAETTNE